MLALELESELQSHIDASFARYRLPLAKIERLATGLGIRWAEGPVWFGDGRYLLVSDIPNNRIVRWDEASGAVPYSPSSAQHPALPGEAVRWHCFYDRASEAQRVVEILKEASGKSAILVRNRAHLDHIVPALKDAGIRFRAVEIEQLGEKQVLQDLGAAMDGGLQVIEVPAARISVEDAVSSYIFNSQLLSIDGQTLLVVPQECQQNASVWQYLEELRDGDFAIDELAEAIAADQLELVAARPHRTTPRSRRGLLLLPAGLCMLAGLDALLFEGPSYQDYEATHVALKDVRRRVRLYPVPVGATATERETIRRAAQREFQILKGIHHPGLLRALEYKDQVLQLFNLGHLSLEDRVRCERIFWGIIQRVLSHVPEHRGTSPAVALEYLVLAEDWDGAAKPALFGIAPVCGLTGNVPCSWSRTSKNPTASRTAAGCRPCRAAPGAICSPRRSPRPPRSEQGHRKDR